jgi:4-fold beta flower protein
MQTNNLTGEPGGRILAIRDGLLRTMSAGGKSGRSGMEDPLYAKSGAPVGFHDGKTIYDLQGQAVGQLRGSRVYCMGGHYFGTLNNGVIQKKSVNRRSTSRDNRAVSGVRGSLGVRNHSSQRTGKHPRQ